MSMKILQQESTRKCMRTESIDIKKILNVTDGDGIQGTEVGYIEKKNHYMLARK